MEENNEIKITNSKEKIEIHVQNNRKSIRWRT